MNGWGWVQNYRDHGGCIFVDLRDRYGLTQIKFDPAVDAASKEAADRLRSEWVIGVRGNVSQLTFLLMSRATICPSNCTRSASVFGILFAGFRTPLISLPQPPNFVFRMTTSGVIRVMMSCTVNEPESKSDMILASAAAFWLASSQESAIEVEVCPDSDGRCLPSSLDACDMAPRGASPAGVSTGCGIATRDGGGQ